MKLLRTIALAAVLVMAGCATIFNGTSQRIQVISEPPGAEVFLDGELAGTTPTEIVVSRRSRDPSSASSMSQGTRSTGGYAAA